MAGRGQGVPPYRDPNRAFTRLTETWRLEACRRTAMTTSANFDRLLLELLEPFRNSTVPLCISDATDPEYPLVSVNAAFTELTGYKESEAIGRNCRFLQGPGTDRTITATLRASLAAGRACRHVLTNYRRDGTPFENDLVITPIRDGAGRLRYFTGVQRVIEQVAARSRLVHLLSLPDGTMRGADGPGERWLDTLPAQERNRLAHACARAAAANVALVHTLPVRGIDGTALEVALNGPPEKLPEGVRFACKAEKTIQFSALTARLRLLETVSVHAWDGIIITEAEPLDRPGPRILFANDAIHRQTGHGPASLIGQTPRVLQGPETDPAELARLGAALRRWEPVSARLLNYRTDGSTFWNELSIVPVADEIGWYTHWVSVQRDVSASQAAAARISFLAEHDELTGLANRHSMRAAIDGALAAARRGGTGCGAVRLDLDRFKLVNDNWGHAAGDALLAATGARLKAVLRGGDVAIRVGGDEFLLVLPGLQTHAALDRAAARILEAVSRPVVFEGREIPVSTSVGAALFPDDAERADALLAAADTALYRAKRLGRGRVDVFSAELRDQAAERRRIADDLRVGLERGEFEMFFQPQLELGSGRVVGIEALLRWRHPERGIVAPGAFLEIAEECGLLGPLSDLAVDQALRTVAAWHQAGVDFGRLAVNLAAPQVARASLAADIAGLLQRYQLPAALLTVELVESVFIGANRGQVADTLATLRRAGIAIDLDDFGTGYASLTHLREFPVDRLKLDRSFVSDIGRDGNDEVIVSAVVKLAHSLGLTCLAEGVETEEQLGFLRRLGCDAVQGYLFARPMDAMATAAWLTREERSVAAARAVAGGVAPGVAAGPPRRAASRKARGAAR